MPVTPEEMRKLALELFNDYGGIEPDWTICDRAVAALNFAADALSPRTGTPERDGEYLVAVRWPEGDLTQEFASFYSGEWARNGTIVTPFICGWWPLPTLPPAADGAKEENSDR